MSNFIVGIIQRETLSTVRLAVFSPTSRGQRVTSDNDIISIEMSYYKIVELCCLGVEWDLGVNFLILVALANKGQKCQAH